MPDFVSITGQRFGRLVALEFQGKDKNGKMRWLCICDCGKTSVPSSNDLRTGKTKSCGCRAGVRHGYYYTPLYACWWNMYYRCLKPQNKEYKNYGGRGITIYERWLNLENFCLDVLTEIGERPSNMSLDRINNDGNYEPGNIRWATPSEQTKNQRRYSRTE